MTSEQIRYQKHRSAQREFVSRFCKERLRHAPTCIAHHHQVYQEYVRWTQSNHHDTVTRIMLSRLMVDIGHERCPRGIQAQAGWRDVELVPLSCPPTPVLTTDAVKLVMARHSDLCFDGVGVPHTFLSRFDAAVKLRQSKKTLQSSLMVPTLAAWWMSEKPKSKSMHAGSNSFVLGLCFHGFTGVPVSTGEIIVGAVFAGFDFRVQRHGGGHVSFNVLEKYVPDIAELNGLSAAERAVNLRNLIDSHGHKDHAAADHFRKIAEDMACST